MEENKVIEEEKHYNQLQLIVFRLGNEEYALKIDQIKEVVLTPNITKVPQTPSYAKGLSNIRGNIISILDLEEKFGVIGIERNTGKYTLVVESDVFKMGIIVNQVPNTLTIGENAIEEAQNIITETSMETNYIKGVIKTESRLIILIDIYQIMSNKEKQKLNTIIK